MSQLGVSTARALIVARFAVMYITPCQQANLDASALTQTRSGRVLCTAPSCD
jgi:hypothetical protein